MLAVNSRLLATVVITLAACACAGGDAPPGSGASDRGRVADSPVARVAAPIDSTISPAVAGEGGWNYVESTRVDLTGDGIPERIVLTARVEMYRGRPAWDDGQPWQVYVEAADGRRTYLYARRLQLGTLTMRVGLGSDARPATIVLLEHLPDRYSVYEVSYRGPEEIAVTLPFQRELDPHGQTASPRLP